MIDNFLVLYKDFISHVELFSGSASFTWKDVFQILVLIFVVFYVYMKFIKNKHSEKLVRGILLFIIAAWTFSSILIALEFQILGQIAQYLLTAILFSMVIVFQPELRKLLVHIGQTKFVSTNFFFNKMENQEEETNVIKEITEAVKYCSRVKRGALIVIQKTEDRALYNDVGTMVNADVSAELILTIFFPNTPLHDGALVVHKDKIVAAGVLLPLTKDPKLSWRYGTRHRAAIGASEISDSACIIVSEETGDISIAIDGILRKYDDIVTFKEDLEKLLTVENERNMENAFISNLLKLRKKQ